MRNPWNEAGQKGIQRISTTEVSSTPSLVQPGMIFHLRHQRRQRAYRACGSRGWMQLTTIEGNTNDSGSGEGIGVFRHAMRRISQIDKLFIDYR